MFRIRDLMNLEGRTVLITGAAGELGRIFSDTIAELGGNLILLDRLGSALNEVCSDITSRWNVKVDVFVCDLEIEDQRTAFIKEIIELGIPINVLINNAAFVGTSKLEGWNVPFEDQSLESWSRALEVNLTAAFHLCQGLMPILRQSEGANIINVASIYGLYGPDMSLYENLEMNNIAAYAASKGGLIQLTRWLSTTVAPLVRVNSISPGGIFRNQPEEFVMRYSNRTPLKRMATENDFRGAITFLATDMSNYVTGQVLSVDGGWGVF